MMKRTISPISGPIALLVAVALFGCSAPGGKSSAVEKQTYVDANLHFAISYPESWAPFLTQPGQGPYPDNSALWEVRKDEAGTISLHVISMLSTEYLPGAQPADILNDIYPNLTLVNRTDTSLQVGKAERLEGYTPRQTLRAWIVRSSLRDFLIIFTAPPEYFADHAALFDTIADSFAILP